MGIQFEDLPECSDFDGLIEDLKGLDARERFVLHGDLHRSAAPGGRQAQTQTARVATLRWQWVDHT